MKIQYREELHLSPKNKETLETINSIIEEYRKEGYKLTLRQLYYQLVSRDVIPNKQSEYAKLSTILTKGRMVGIVDWDAIEDRLRVPNKAPSWEDPAEIIEVCAKQYRKDRLEDQTVYIEAWVEKDALSGVLKRVTNKYGIHLMVNRGYSSTSAMHDSYERFKQAWEEGKTVHILYLGDHDPSGIDMIRDIRERTAEFARGDGNAYEFENLWDINRIALTGKQIKKYNPPPNPTKLTDPRAKWYMERYGNTCWEVDALNPKILNELLDENIEKLINYDNYLTKLEEEEKDKEKLQEAVTWINKQ